LKDHGRVVCYFGWNDLNKKKAIRTQVVTDDISLSAEAIEQPDRLGNLV
jgi:hypothetical protein